MSRDTVKAHLSHIYAKLAVALADRRSFSADLRKRG